jgi:hypothetical protein
VAGGETGPGAAAPRKRADARRNEATPLDAVAAAACSHPRAGADAAGRTQHPTRSRPVQAN